MKLKKIIFILIFPFLLTGCAVVSYDIEIGKNLTVNEKAFITATNDYFKLFYKDFPNTIVKEAYNNQELIKPLKDNQYTYKLETESVNNPGISVSKKYNSIDEYTKKTVFKGQPFKDIISTTIGNNLVNVKTSEFIPYTDDVTEGYLVSEMNITFKIPYVVTNNNADSVNKKTNTFTWHITEDTKEKEINFTFDKSRIYIYSNYLVEYISIVIIIILVVIIILYTRKLIKKNKNNNRLFD